MKALAICLWVLAWCAASIATAAIWAAVRGRDSALPVAVASAAALGAAGLAWAGAALW